MIYTHQNIRADYNITIDKATIDKGYTVTAFDDAIKLSLVPGVLASATPVEVIRLDEPMDYPWHLNKLSHVYQFEFKNKQAHNDHHPFYIQVNYEETSAEYKKVFFYDKNYNTWRPLPTKDFPEEKFVRSLIHLPYARIAVFSFPETMTSGKASWYAYKGSLFAASPDYPKGSKLRVFNNDNGKYVDIIVNDYGPDRSIHPDRPIDLDKVAFARIADLSEGIIDVTIEPLEIVKDAEGLELAIPETGVGATPIVDTRASTIIDADTGEVLHEYNASTSMPLASLTKLVSVYTFLQLDDDFDRVVTYKDTDAEYNYEYCKPWESAKLNIPDGEELTVGDLVHSSLVSSTNNTVESLVRVSGVSRADFIKKMNETVASFGASSTHFVEPTGLAPENITTALDYALISQKVLENKTLASISVKAEYEFTTLSTDIDKRLRNTNHIIKTNQYNIVGSKTGYLHESLYCLMTKVDIEAGKSIIVVTLGAETRDISFRETSELIRYGVNKLQSKSL